VLAALFALNGTLLVRKIETYPFLVPELRSDPTVDRARIARNVQRDLAAARLPAGTRLELWSPSAIEMVRAQGRDTSTETYWESNVRNALADGLGIRVLFPQVRAAEFVHDPGPGDASTLYALYRLDGHLAVVRRAALDSTAARSRAGG
jgi:hypothetical protein